MATEVPTHREVVSSFNHIAQKRAESGYALLQAASLPYENYIEKDGPKVPGLYPSPEVQVNDVIVVDATVDASRQGYVEFIPDLFGGLARYADASAKVWAGRWTMRGTFRIPADGAFHPVSNVYADMPDGSLVIGVGPMRQLTLDTVANWAANVTFQMEGSVPYGSVSIRLDYFDNGTGTWVTMGSGYCMNGVPATAPGTSGLNFSLIRVQVASTSAIGGTGLSITGAFTIAVQTTLGSLRGDSEWPCMERVPYPFLTQLPDVQSYRRIAGALLCTYTGSQLVNGGKIAAALVPVDWTPPDPDDPYNSVASLRNDRYDGPLRDGSDVTWRPHSLLDLLPCDFSNASIATSKVVVGFRFDDAAASMRLRAMARLGVYSPNPIVGKMEYTAAATDAMLEALILYYANTPAATSNKLHQVSKALKAMGAKAISMSKALLEHDKLIAAALAAAGQGEASAVVLGAGKAYRSVRKVRNAKKAAGSKVPKARPRAAK